MGSSFGAGMGLLLMQWLPEWNIQPGLYAMCAAAAMLGGVFRSSISLVVIVVEGTQASPSSSQSAYMLPMRFIYSRLDQGLDAPRKHQLSSLCAMGALPCISVHSACLLASCLVMEEHASLYCIPNLTAACAAAEYEVHAGDHHSCHL